MKYKLGDRVVYRDKVTRSGTIVSHGITKNRGNFDLFAYNLYDVLWDDEDKILEYMECYLYPESITMSENRQPNLTKRIEDLERVNRENREISYWLERKINSLR